ncbi:hypothetical protein E2C01_068365 [Portunus trituberculatus]|uniref:Uncharacterized protein n=1 Tax=Portunus trituberculatus TaxID=210409 RepID=A0A5B7HNN1_PORTR|nr:hypothetical protein [Portunus trituberculatus]
MYCNPKRSVTRHLTSSVTLEQRSGYVRNKFPLSSFSFLPHLSLMPQRRSSNVRSGAPIE